MIPSADPSADIRYVSANRGVSCYDFAVNRIFLGILLGLAAGVIDVLLMLPMTYPNKATAMTGAFFNRFAIGFLAPNVMLPIHPVLAGALVGLLVSIPDAVTTKVYAPIIGTGLVFGALAGWAGRAWAT